MTPNEGNSTGRPDLGRRVAVVGASTGLGRCLGIGLGQRGAKVALLARREARLIVGECTGGEGDAATQFAASWDTELAGQLFPEWTARGLLTDKLMDVDHFVSAVHTLVQHGASITIPSIAITPRRPI
jgi:NAD(P)-dependent dehydrogenase (short-subunit alcohol dehydrogenase family)